MSTTSSEAACDSPSGSGKDAIAATILVVDDDPDFAGTLEEQISRSGLKVVACGTPEEALARAGDQIPDLFLVALVMPGMDGLDLCRKILGDSRFENVPVLLMTGQVEPEERGSSIVRALEAGVDDYLIKPFGFKEMIARLRAWLRVKRARDELASASGQALSRLLECERRLTVREERLLFLSNMVEQVSDSVIVTGPDFRITYVNPATERLFGYAADELEGKTPEVLNVEPDADDIQAALYEQVSRGAEFTRSCLNRRKDGSTFVCEFKVSAIRDAGGEICGYIGVQRDVTKHQEAERDLRQSEERNRMLLQHAGVSIAYWDAAGRLLMINDVGAELLGGSRDQLQGRTLVDIYGEERGGCYLRRMEQVIAGRQSLDFEDSVELPTGSKWFLSSYSPITRAGGEVDGVQTISHDITLRKRLEEEQEAYARELEEEACRTREYADLLTRSSHPGSALVGQGLRFQEVVEFIRTVAPLDASVLILGESGTGKEVVARTIHAGGRRAGMPFVVLDCATVKGDLLESDLFGHEKGAFTGAHAAKPGLIEVADGGTLFVDEIGEMPPDLQAKLLRVLDRGELRRVGGTAERRVDIRVIAATNRDLAADVRSGRFREDLFFRVNVMRVELPPLRERREDVPLLARHFLRNLRVTPPTPKHLKPEVVRSLQAYDWPGNVRELANVIERAVILSGSREVIRLVDLPSEVREAVEAPAARRQARSLAEAEREAIVQALEATGGNKTLAAKVLGIARITLRKKIQKYGIAEPAADTPSSRPLKNGLLEQESS